MKKQGVICAIDVNDFDQDVIDLAASFAKQFDVDLDLLHVTLFPDPTNAAWPAYVGAPDELIRDDHILKEIGTCIEGVIVRRHHLSGIPSDQILGFAERHEPRLLILGTHARRGIKRLLGSVASKVMRNATCPVMILRQRTLAEKSTTCPAVKIHSKSTNPKSTNPK